MCSGSAAGARWFDLAGLVAWVGLVCAAGSVVWAVPWGLVERVVPWGHSRSIIEVVFAMTGAALRSVFVCGPWSSIAALKPLILDPSIAGLGSSVLPAVSFPAHPSPKSGPVRLVRCIGYPLRGCSPLWLHQDGKRSAGWL